MPVYDIAIIGGGPVGMFAAFYAGIRDTNAILLESLPQLGGQVSTLYPEKTILDAPGNRPLTGQALVAQLSDQMAEFPITVQTQATVTNVEKQDDGTFVLTVAGQPTVQAKAVIVATGKGAFTPRQLQVDLPDDLPDGAVDYFLKPVTHYAGQRVVIAGGGDSAVDMALLLAPYAAEVTLIHRRETFRALEQSVKALDKSRVRQCTPYQICAITRHGETEQLAITVNHAKNKLEHATVIADDLIVAYGFIAKNTAVAGWQTNPSDAAGQVAVNQCLCTEVTNMFAIGDVATYPGRDDLIALGFGEAPLAVNMAIARVLPDRRGPGHSSSLTPKQSAGEAHG